ncbi:MAG: DUF2007 domain-containing protein [Armatimonadota bacterium]|nr:DUF2007 domain-containing protein [Armatimonadota bacterium]
MRFLERWLGRRLVRIYSPSSEAEALLLKDLLEREGIPVLLRSRQIPGYGDIISRATGVWGDLLVPAEFEARARHLLQAPNDPESSS